MLELSLDGIHLLQNNTKAGSNIDRASLIAC